jgi:hypothetical protein
MEVPSADMFPETMTSICQKHKSDDGNATNLGEWLLAKHTNRLKSAAIECQYFLPVSDKPIQYILDVLHTCDETLWY